MAQARPVEYDPSLFDYGPTSFDPPLPHDLGFAGWRLHYHTNFAQDVAVFLGASYFRATDAGSQYGISCRGLAVDTGLDRPEEFPRFSRFWLVRPRPTDTTLTAYALLEGESVTGAYRFGISPGGVTTIEVTAQLFPRKPIERLGIAPMTSMFWFGENERRITDEWREEIHDSDGLSMWRGNGEWVWRPLTNPPSLQVSSFLDENPRGFGLLQRDRDFAHYQDEAFRYERRPSVWIEPLANWGKGRVLLSEIPTDDETNDNIVAFWQPDARRCPGAQLELAYRIHWCQRAPVQPSVAICVGTRIGRGGVTGFVQPNPKNLRKFVIDFAGGDLRTDPQGRTGRAGHHPVARQGRAGDVAGRPVSRLAVPAPVARDQRLALHLRSLVGGPRADRHPPVPAAGADHADRDLALSVDPTARIVSCAA